LVFFAVFFLLLSGCNDSSTVADDGCASCHRQVVTRFDASPHGQAGLTCVSCHENLEAHLQLSRNLPSIDVYGDTCAACHTEEHSQWLASPHAQIPLDLFPKDPRIMECMKCHQGSGFAQVIESGANFITSWGPMPTRDPEAVTCIACHSLHNPRDTQMLRLPKGELCSTCHGSKWQNLILTGTGGHPYQNYSAFQSHPHNDGERCAACHMAQTPGIDDLGGHTFSMRTTKDGKQNIAACSACHENVTDYNINNLQSEVAEALNDLRSALEARNNGELPGNEPGTCNQCHRGGTLPFEDDPKLILGNAYENYKLVDQDKSLGVHNPNFALQILRDALESAKSQ
jgi:predicted CXXCH cytochrome family protein